MYKTDMSTVEEEIIRAYNVKTRTRWRPMKVTAIYVYDPTKYGRVARYRLAGKDAENGDKLSRFCTKKKAEAASKEHGLEIINI